MKDTILDILEKYNSEFDVKNNILTIREPMSVSLFVYIKKYIKEQNPEVEIRIETIRRRNEHRGII